MARGWGINREKREGILQGEGGDNLVDLLGPNSRAVIGPTYRDDLGQDDIKL